MRIGGLRVRIRVGVRVRIRVGVRFRVRVRVRTPHAVHAALGRGTQHADALCGLDTVRVGLWQ